MRTFANCIEELSSPVSVAQQPYRLDATQSAVVASVHSGPSAYNCGKPHPANSRHGGLLTRTVPGGCGIIGSAPVMSYPQSLSAAETLLSSEFATVERFGRYVVAELDTPHLVLSTSAHKGGQQANIRFIANHQSCEASGDRDRETAINQLGLKGYHFRVCEEMRLDPDRTALMGTAANMAYACHRWAEYEDLRSDAIVTAGVSGNAARAGDPAQWSESEDGWRKITPHSGTINTILLLNWPITPSALARAVVTMTEAKSAALSELAVPSLYSPTLATGTGTDQFCIAAPTDSTRNPKDSTGPHAKLGEIIGRSVKCAVKEALRWQNGLEPSYTRGIFHALGRFGLTEERALTGLARLLTRRQFDLLGKNRKAVFFEPGVSAAAFALAAVLDRVAFGTLPDSAARWTLRQQAASLACSLAARPQDWGAIYGKLDVETDDPVELVLRAIALGWQAKWT